MITESEQKRNVQSFNLKSKVAIAILGLSQAAEAAGSDEYSTESTPAFLIPMNTSTIPLELNTTTMNIKRIFGAAVAFLFTVALAFGLQVNSASAAPADASFNQLSQGGTLVANIGQTFQFNFPYPLLTGEGTTLSNTPNNFILMRVQNNSPAYDADLFFTYLQQAQVIHIDANDPSPKLYPFDPNGSVIQLQNVSQSSSSKVTVLFTNAGAS